MLAWLITIAYCNRLTGTLFGLDQINAFIATYLMVGDSGGAWSVDRWLAGTCTARRAERRREHSQLHRPSDTNIAMRLLQVHMCVIYLFGGIAQDARRDVVGRQRAVVCVRTASNISRSI